tara:strand:+ start:764 stop:1696 length:933 start_codon:yes stop_codon:yes gene_type:complete
MSQVIKKINFNHSFIFFIFCNIFSLLVFKTNINISPLICLFLILLIGVSHGSLDHIKGKKLFEILKIKNISSFYLIYILITFFIIILWIFLPTFSLIIFLIVASFHFGKEDTEFLFFERSYLIQLMYLLKGSLVILAPIYFHFDETVSIFKLLLVENETFYTILSSVEEKNILLLSIIISSISSIYLFTKQFEIKKFTIFLDYFSIILLNYFLSPLVAFTMYFCFLHSIRHSITLVFEIDKNNLKNGVLTFIKKAMPLTFLTAVLCIVGLYFLNKNYGFDNSILKLIFIGLASLTFPHILLEYFLEKNEK